MLKRKRPPPPSWASASRIQSSESQPEKAIERFEASHAEVMRAIKKARVFDQQRLVKKIQEEKEPDKVKGKRKGKPRRKPQATGAHANADGDAATVLNTDLIARLERELAVIKTLDMEITARVHLAHAMSRVKGLVDAPGPLPAHLQVAEVLATRSKAARTEDTHNVTSSLYNKPFVRDAVAKAVKEMCQLIGVPDKKEPLKKDKTKTKDTKPKEKKEKQAKADDDDDDDDDDGADGAGINYNDDDDDEIERELAKYDAMLGGDDKEGSDDDDDADESSDDDNDNDDEDAEIAKLRAKYKRALAKGLIADDARDDYSGDDDGEDDFDGFSGGEEEEDDDDDDEEEEDDSEEEESSESEVEKRPRKRAAASAPAIPGASNFLPSLMGGYLAADADDHSDGYGSDEAHRDERAAAKLLGVVRKNRRGQRARQAIWEKKYKADAKHVIQEKLNPKPVAEKWDAKRGAVDANDQPRWLRRKLAMGGKPAYAGGSGGSAASKPAPAPKKNENANKQVTGTLHPSWEAARKAKEAAQTAEYKGTKIVFD